MTLQEANKLLDMTKHGMPIPAEVVDESLFMSGDANWWSDQPCPDIEDFVQALRQEGLL